jgi:hypothetical protein
MGLVRIALIFGLGYALGRPEGKAKVVELAKRPEVARLRHRTAVTVSNGLERGWKKVAAGTETVSGNDPAETNGSAVTTGRGGWRGRRLPSFPRRGIARGGTSAGMTPTGSASTQPEVPPVPSTQPLPPTRPTI